MTEFFKNLISVDHYPELHEISRHTILKSTCENTQIFSDEIQESVFFVRSGVVRSYYVKGDGTEITEWLFSTGDIIYTPDALFYDRKPHITLQALTSSILVKLKKTDYFAFRKTYPFFKSLTKSLEFSLVINQREYRENRELLSDGDLYRVFADRHPYIISQVKGKHLALFFRVTPSVISRMKKQYQKFKKY